MNTKFKLSNRILSLVLALVLVLGMMPMTSFTAFAATTPTAYDGVPVTPTVITSSNYQQFGLTESNWSSYNGYYGIRDAKELYGFAELVNDGNNTIKGVLLQDIVINESVSESGATYSWTPIGNSSNEFIGTFDGNGHTVSGLYINSSGTYVGMFGVHGRYADYTETTIKNLTIANSYICGKSEVGGITGAMTDNVAVISNCKIAPDVTIRATTSGDAYLGGICGSFTMISSFSSACSVKNCVVLGKVDAPNSSDYVGAIVGIYRSSTNAYEFIVVSDCYYITENTTDADGITGFGKGSSGLVSSNDGCTKLTSVSDSHTCVSVTHREVLPTCQYPGLSEYSFCLICGAVTSGTYAVTAANSNAHVYYGATCCVAGVCGVCNTTGSKNMENHGSTEYIYRSSGTQHTKYHACCNTLVGTEDHTYNSEGMCLYCEYVCPHDQYDSKDRCLTCGYLLSTVPTKVTTSNCESLGLDASYVGYYAISNKYELYWFARLVNGTIDGVDQDTDANAVLLRDITVNEHIFDSDGNLVSNTDALIEWIPIGFNVSDSTAKTGYDFSGIFDGQNHTISGLYHNSTENWYVGLFGSSAGMIHSVTVSDSYLTGNQRIGGIVGWNEGSIYKCASVECQIIGTDTSDTYIGGVVGVSSGGHIENCYSSSSVSGSGNVGGICAWIQRDVTVKNCYTNGSVIGNNNVGGIVGQSLNNDKNANSHIENCYFSSDVFAGSGIGYLGRGTATNVEGKSTEQFASGEIAWLLNNSTSEGVWKQTIGTDAYPKFTGSVVYYDSTSGYYNHIHQWTYSKDDDKITAICIADDCEKTDGGSVTISAPSSLTYTGNKIEAFVEDTLKTGDTVKVVYSAEPINVGEYTATITLDGKAISVTYEITAASISDATVSVGGSYTYDGNAKEPTEITVALNGKTLTKDTDYTVSYSDNVNAGTAKVIITGTGNYTGTANGTFTITDATDPTGEIKIGENGWKKFINWITFGFFYKDNVDVTVTADGTGSDVVKVEYLFSSTAMDASNMPTDGWTEVSESDGKYKFSIQPQNKGAVYVRITDESGNVAVINSEGIVVYQDSKVKENTVYYTYKSTDDVEVELELNGNTVKDIEFNGHAIANYWSVSGNTLTLDADYLSNLVVLREASSYPITVYFNPLGEETDKVELKVEFALIIQKADGKVSNISDLSKTYDGTAVSAPTFDKLGDGTATIEYKLKYADDSTYTTTAPSNAGDYVVRVTVAEGSNYKAASETAEFTISSATLTVTQLEPELNWYPQMSESKTRIKNYFTVKKPDGSDYSFRVSEILDENNNKVSKIENAGTYTIKIAPYFSSSNYVLSWDTFALRVNPLDLSAIDASDYFSVTAVDPTYTGSSAFPQMTESGILAIHTYIFNVYNDREQLYALANEDGYWTFEAADGKNCTAAGDAYVYIVGDGTNVIGKYEYKYNIKQQTMETPIGLTAVNETISKKADGKINGLTTDMEYSISKYGEYTTVTDADMSFAVGTYYVRTSAPDSNYKPSDAVELTISEGRKLTVTLPQNQVGYRLTTTTPEMDWYGTLNVKFELLEGYTMTEDFEIYNGTEPMWRHFNQDIGILQLTLVGSDFDFSVVGVADVTEPAAEISITDNKWNKFLNDITFGLFFKETQDVTITANDTGSGLKDVFYYVADRAMSAEELQGVQWTAYTEQFSIDPDGKHVIYVKAIDNAGNVLVINSDGIVLDATAPTVYGIENGGAYYGDKVFKVEDDYLETLKVDGVDVTADLNGDNEYKIVADNDEHTVVVTDSAGNVTEYKVTVYKNYTVTYKADGEVVSTQTVGHGKDATAPEIPEKVGYTQTAPVWDKDGTNITADMEINAVYAINKYTVTYKADGEIVETVTVEHGKDATAPAIPEKVGYTQTAPAWDKDGKNITADTEINAVYTINKYTVTYKADGEVVDTVDVEHGANVPFQYVPKKNGYVGKWDRNNENITADTEINAVYTKLADIVPDDFKPEDKSELEDTKKQLEEMLKDGGYTEDDKKDIQDAINEIDDALEVIGNVENVEDLIDEIPNTVTKDDEDAIKAADDAYHALTDEEKTLVDPDAKKALDDAKAALEELKKPVSDPDSPQTGDNSNLWLWFALLFISGAGIFGITVYDRKRKATSKR